MNNNSDPNFNPKHNFDPNLNHNNPNPNHKPNKLNQNIRYHPLKKIIQDKVAFITLTLTLTQGIRLDISNFFQFEKVLSKKWILLITKRIYKYLYTPIKN